MSQRERETKRGRHPERIRVFISYSHDSEDHREEVLRLANRLRKDGVDARLDRFVSAPKSGWPRWMKKQIDDADIVICVCSTTYKRRFDGLEDEGKGQGVNFEGYHLLQELYRNDMRNERFAPVILGDLDDQDVVPSLLGGFQYWKLPGGYDDLFRYITKQPEIVPGELGQLRKMPTKSSGYEVADEPEPLSKPLREYLEYWVPRWWSLRLREMEGEEAENKMTLDQVFIDLDTTTRVKKDGSPIRDRESMDDDDVRLLRASEAVARENRLLLTGDPGSGKTSFAHILLGKIAKERLSDQPTPGGLPEGLPGGLIGVRIVLRLVIDRLRKAKSTKKALVVALLDHLAEEGNAIEGIREELERVLSRGPALVVFDGFDEVPEGDRERVRATLDAVADLWWPERLLVTCRIRSYEEKEWRGFAVHHLAPFDDAKIRSFVEGWYQTQADAGLLDDESKVKKRVDSLTTATSRQDMRGMAGNPMLLTTMALVHYRFGELPRERAKLYKRAVDLLVQRWRREENLKQAKPELREFLEREQDVLGVLQGVAFVFQNSSAAKSAEQVIMTRQQLVVHMEKDLRSFGLAEQFLEFIDYRAGLLQGDGGTDGETTYSFAHRTFQEYLAGCALHRDPRRAENFLREVSNVGESWNLAVVLGLEDILYNSGPRGQTDALILAYALGRPCDASNSGVWRRRLWSAHLAQLIGADVIREDRDPDGEQGEAYWDRIRNDLVDLIEGNELPFRERLQAGDLLAKMGDPRFEEGFFHLPRIRDNGAWIRDPMVGFRWVIAPGEEPVTFEMGSDEKHDEGPIHPVTLTKAFAMARYPVTQAQYARFLEEGGKGSGTLGEPFDFSNHPAVKVNWHGAIAYSKWIHEKLSPYLDKGWEVRLPTEAEWECAARMDRVGQYPFGGSPDVESLNSHENGHPATSSVGCFSRGDSSGGISDLSGNVWEWSLDLGDYGVRSEAYCESGIVDPISKRGAFSVVRGGSWDIVARRCRSSNRSAYERADRRLRIGFRLVLARVQSSEE